jgi:hypothetical protein
MDQAQRSLTAEKTIAKCLKSHTSVDTGIGYNTLYDAVLGELAVTISRRTFDRALDRLVERGAVSKQPDSRRKRGVVIFATSRAPLDRLLIDARTGAERLLRYPMKSKTLYHQQLEVRLPISPGETQRILSTSKQFGRQEREIMENLILWHAIFFKLHDDIPADSYVSTDGKSIRVLRRTSYEELRDGHAMLRRILEEAKDDLEKRKWLERLGAFPSSSAGNPG